VCQLIAIGHAANAKTKNLGKSRHCIYSLSAESLVLRLFARTVVVANEEILRASWLSSLTCGGKKDEIRKCLRRRGFNVEAIEKTGSTEEQMRTPANGEKGNVQ
jgi:hypothetical protein